MSVRSVECKLCGAKYKVPVSAESRRLSCKKCGRSIFVSASRRARQKAGPAPDGRRGKKSPVLLALTFVVLVVAGAVLFLT